MSARGMATAMAAVLAIASLWSLWASGPPAVVPKTAATTEASAERAAVHVAAIAQRPHPVGSADHDRVRDYVLGELTKLGLSPEVQKTTGIMVKYRTAGSVENIVARLRGTTGAPGAVLLACHYDSVPAGPGAGDDAAGVAAVLEALRAIVAGPPLKNDLIVLVSDAEEAGLVGASAFVDEHPWAKDVRVALNFDARGDRGASLMFQTSPGNAALVSLLGRAAPDVSANSLSYEIYRRLPNDTDMTVFLEHGAAGLNFAFIGGWEAYHTPLDTPARLALGSLQQHASYALALARALGDTDLSGLRLHDDVYFSLPGGLFVRYSTTVAWLLAGLSIAGFFAVVAFVVRAGAARVGHVALGLLAALGATLASMAIGMGFVWLVERGQSHGLLPDGDVLRSRGYALCLGALVLGVWMGLYSAVAKRLSWTSLAAGASMLLAVLLAASTARLTGASYLFLWPLVAAAGSIAVAAGAATPARMAALALLALPAVVIFVPLARGLFEGVGVNAFGAPGIALALALACAALSSQLGRIVSAAPRAAPGAALATAGLLLVLAAWTTRYGAEHPKPSIMVYALDADARRARWESTAPRLDPWTAAHVGDTPVRGPIHEALRYSQVWLSGDAPAIDLPPPEVSLLSSTESADGTSRDVVLRARSPRHARELLLVLPQAVLRAAVDGHGLPWVGAGGSGDVPFRYVNLPDEGVELTLSVATGKTLKVVAIDATLGLPPVPGQAAAARPADSMQNHWGDQTTVRTVRAF